MAAQSKQKLTFDSLAGVEQRWKAPTLNAADDISTARIDPNGGGWLFDRGIEPWWDPGSTFTPGLDQDTIKSLFVDKVDSIYVWSKQNTEQVYYLVESGGVLYYWWGNKGSTSVANFYDDLVTIQKGRHIPKLNEAGTQYIPYGNRLLIINGYDKPIWFYGREKSRDFGFTLPSPSPEPLDIQPKFLAGTEDLNLGVAAPSFISKAIIGLGYGADDEPNNFDYKMTFITDTGSESPLSSPTGLSWQTDTDTATQKKFGVVIKHLPVGPYESGIVARRLYRTKNQRQDTASTGANDSVYYLVNEIKDNVTDFYVDIIPDGQLLDTAPSIADTSTIQTGYSYGATWNSSIWLAGGSQNPTKVIYSKQGLPEQFGAFDYFDIGNTAGGAITGVAAYYNNLIIFRQKSIDMVRIGNGGQYQISQLNPEIGTTATNTIKLVPGIGLLFMGYDGIYAISGGLDGGSQIIVQRISQPLAKEIPNVSRVALPRASAVYSSKEREYWVHYTPNGATYNQRGIVYHTDTGNFSLRHTNVEGKEYLWGFTALCSDTNGNIIIGTRPEWTSDPFTLNPTPSGYLVGLHVWSGYGGWGKKLALSAITQDSYEYTVTDVARPFYQWQSDWIDFGDNSIKHRVYNIEVEIISYGDTTVNLTWSQDYSATEYSAGAQKLARTETLFTTKEDAVFGPDSGASKNYFTVGKSSLQEPRRIRLRWDVQTGLVDTFKWTLSGFNTFHVVSADINFESATNMIPLNQRINIQKGQPQ